MGKANFDRQTKNVKLEGKRLSVVEVRCVSAPDAEGRIARAINILLASAMRRGHLEENVNPKQKEIPSQGPAHENLASDEVCD